jgi:hypothetical protein
MSLRLFNNPARAEPLGFTSRAKRGNPTSSYCARLFNNPAPNLLNIHVLRGQTSSRRSFVAIGAPRCALGKKAYFSPGAEKKNQHNLKTFSLKLCSIPNRDPAQSIPLWVPEKDKILVVSRDPGLADVRRKVLERAGLRCSRPLIRRSSRPHARPTSRGW